MSSEKFANLAEDELASGYTSGGSSIAVTDASLFPTAGVFRVALGNADRTIYRVDSVSGTTFTGGAEEFDANASAGDTVTLVGSKGAAERFLQSPESGALRSPSGASGAVFYGPTWKLPLTDPSGYTWVNQGSASITFANGTAYLLTPGAAGTNVRALVTAVPGGAYTVTAAVLPGLPGGTHAFTGLTFREASSGKLYDIHVYNAGGATTEQVRVVKWTNPTTASGVVATRSIVGHRGPIWLRIADNATNVIFSYSPDGVNWMQISSEARGTFMSGGSGPTQYGIDISCEDTSTAGGAAGSFISLNQS